jgi:tetratricopeptide (TPR) repeat protein
VSDLYAQYIIRLGEVGLAVMYAKNSIDLYEKLSTPILPLQYQSLAELLYKVREYDECVRYGKKAAAGWKKWQNESDTKKLLMNCINTIGLGYHRQKKFDSAFLFYSEALQLAKNLKNTVWIGIVSGNMGQILYAQEKYNTAYRLVKIDYNASKEAGYYDNAANSLQWAAQADLAQGHKDAALAQAREAFQLLQLHPDAGYLRNTYYTAAQVFRELGLYDSAFYYTNLWSALNDSLEKVVATSSISISSAKLNDERSRYEMQILNQEKRLQLLTRNLLITFTVVLSVIALLLVNRKRLQEKLKTERANQENVRMEQEVASARVQLKMFTENIVEKMALIEKLELQAKGKESASEQQAIVAELSRQTILTEEDWTTFKSLFEKIHPAFFVKLKEKFPDITSAEQRMAAFTRLNLTTKQAASTLGISLDSVHKSRQRLRQRFQVEGNEGLDEMVADL